jgi:hypothetical protein
VISVQKKKKEWLERATFQESGNTTKQTSLQTKINAIWVGKETDKFHAAKEQDLSNYKTNDVVNGGGHLQI